MIGLHLIRIGALGAVGRFRAAEPQRFPRGAQVIVRSPRGLELGEVLAEPDRESPSRAADGLLLRRVTPEDQMLALRLEKRRIEAFAACQSLLVERGLQATLVDVEPLFDGASLFFYFLGEVSPEIESLTAELAEAYESEAQLRRFGDVLATGCGPACGTEQGGGGSCESCSSCGSGGCGS